MAQVLPLHVKLVDLVGHTQGLYCTFPKVIVLHRDLMVGELDLVGLVLKKLNLLNVLF